MDLRQLRYFVAIVEQGSFSRAAQVLNVAQPALSAHVRNMEADLGMRLLFRSAQGVVPTEAGATMLRNARLIIDQVATAEAEIRGHAAEPQGEVRIGIPGTISQKLAVPLILAVRTRYPGIKLRIAEAMSGFVLDWLRAGHVDLAILYMPAVDRGLASERLFVEELCLLGPARPKTGLRTPGGPSVDFSAVAELPLILPGQAHGLRQMLERLAVARNVTLNSELDVDSYAAIKDLVARGLGFSILPLHAVASEVTAERLRCWSIVDPVIQREVHLVRPSDRPVPRAVSVVESLCREVLLSLVAEGAWDGAGNVAPEKVSTTSAE
ncbi:LysR family transcriptional regulator [Nitratireductor sp. ZSWI3]|uniref:LysR family transcriptional regulator n=1 Tax=Nitratireductor sp. ZSWI3 TaxID=2966359 RepID=UPI00214FA9E4|nr:LysR substrate-binding domain-containing protein [Nitratireductor sp. ZSWI3]MCR4265297.1 LysR substrate-binding domain-containing protein [Nitratireductor sp. ZSWI3]